MEVQIKRKTGWRLGLGTLQAFWACYGLFRRQQRSRWQAFRAALGFTWFAFTAVPLEWRNA